MELLRRSAPAWGLPVLFGLTLFGSAAFLFWVQPLVARRVLPLLGGAPAVWNTCMLFFQALLLAGYGYSHLSCTRLGRSGQVASQLLLLALAVLFLFWDLSQTASSAPDYAHPLAWLLGWLLLHASVPFFALTTLSPLLQSWFSATAHPRAQDPYFLYAASNLGSLAGLLGYPLLLEPLFPLRGQQWFWIGGCAVLWGLTLACACCLGRRSTGPAEALVSNSAPLPRPLFGEEKGGAPLAAQHKTVADSAKTSVLPALRPPAGLRLLWLLLAFVPCSLMLSVTTYLTTDVAPVPLLWVIPLALYLGTLILAFAPRPLVPLEGLWRWLPLVILIATLLLLTQATESKLGAWLPLGLHLLTLTAVAWFCHGALAALRPAAVHLTAYYWWVSLGGVLGGAFNGLLAPVLFARISEYPLALVLACLLRWLVAPLLPIRTQAVPSAAVGRWQLRWKGLTLTGDAADGLWPVALGLLAAFLLALAQTTGLPLGPLSTGLVFGVPLLLCYLLAIRPLAFTLALAALLIVSSFSPGGRGQVEYRVRNFFGVHEVVLYTDEQGQRYRRLFHGTTIHGQQSLDPARRREPLTYYQESPIHKLLQLLQKNQPPVRDIAVIGLGAGSLAALAQPGEHWTFYEIDPQVVEIAQRYFTFLRDCPAGAPDIRLGDARLLLTQTNDQYDLLILDAFSSDALPVHLFTREALAIYRQHLRPGGVLACHISSRYLDLSPVLARLADEAGLRCFDQQGKGDPRRGLFPSHWVILSLPDSPFLQHSRWSAYWLPLPADPRQPLWTDDHTPLLKLLRLAPAE